MQPRRWLPLVVCLTALLPALASAQPPTGPQIAYVYPAGGQQGTTVRVKVGGRFLDGTVGAVWAERGLRAEVVSHDKPLTPREVTERRERLEELRKRAADPSVGRELDLVRRQIADTIRRNNNPALSEWVVLDVTIDADAEPGLHPLRLDATAGLSNPLPFSVSQLPEVCEPDGGGDTSEAARVVPLPVVLNGQITPSEVGGRQPPPRPAPQVPAGDVDRFRFRARQGQELVIVVTARELIPYLADAVPGWFQAVVAVYDSGGRELAYADDERFHPDPVARVRVPTDGEYEVEIRDALYRGREDFVYRIAIGELPFVSSIFPLGAPPAGPTVVQVEGWNLPGNRTTVQTTGSTTGLMPLTVRRHGLASNVVPFLVDEAADTLEHEPNDRTRDAHRLTMPIVVNGRIQRPGDVDVFTFHGTAGQRVVAEIVARRLGSPLDSVLELTDAAGRRLAFNDDHEDRGAALVTHQADSWLSATLPAAGVYVVRVSDRTRHGGPDHGYRLRLGTPRPDFELRVTPSALNVGAGTTAPATVHAIRRDGFDGEITLTLADAPPGCVLSGGVIPAGQSAIRVTLTAPALARRQTWSLQLDGRATIDGRTVSRRAVAADDMMQAFAYRHLVPAAAWYLSVLTRGALRTPVRILTPQPIRLAAGGRAVISVALPQPRAFESLSVELSEPPDGITVRDLSFTAGGAQFVIEADPARSAAGLRGNLIAVVSGVRVPPTGQNAATQATAQRRRQPIATLPAIRFEIGPAPPRDDSDASRPLVTGRGPRAPG